ncbi:N-6 DNA methylase [Blastococcus sp. TF02A-30]|uniref:N-6 DNA methylase n=1 Tax=Blastococcus sp. TF02A-30 TaxID=2250580 RepID=UPI000DEA29D0|nr:N-6 DNA methylase [Blastococcus sp. TF02A-30]RBY92681.1 SAM-dependent DNA methyltransferase [Blastococcus sp. TF02A-30]
MSKAGAEVVVRRLVLRDTVRTEADVQADIYALLTGSLNLQPDQVVRLEVPTGDGTRRRLDVAVGHCVIEVKKDLRPGGIRRDAEIQLAGYVVDRTALHQRRYVGVLTDGTEWVLYDLRDDKLVPVATLIASAADPERLLDWLEAILATESGVTPSPEEIDQRLGAGSPAHLLDHAALMALYDKGQDLPEVRMKRTLWARLLRTAFGSAFRNDDSTFIDHTLLVMTAEVIAHAVVGIDVSAASDITPTALISGTAFEESQVRGVVEADFFDWLLNVDGGEAFIRTLADRISRFDWSHVEHDVLKHLYESVITAEDRASLGEYYTPDWLADRMVDATVSDPLNQRVLDPSCGSGTFVFHAARAFLAAAEAAEMPTGKAVAELTTRVIGMEIHPVAVTLARVTYLLAIGSDRLSAPDRPAFSVPVYLGDSLQWEQNKDLFRSDDHVSISTTTDELTGEGGGGLYGAENLVFPRSVLHDAGAFDRLVSEMADKALDTSKSLDRTLVDPILRRYGIDDADRQTLRETFSVMRLLASTGRNHIWGYYVRNLIRPIWLAEPDNRVDVLIGNPPWLRYSKMTAAMQDRYKMLCEPRQLLSGGLGASGRDLSTLFVVRAVELYLRTGGTFAFVMPHGTLTRLPHTGFRSGRWSPNNAQTASLDVAFDVPWDLSKAPTGFPMVSCVVRGDHTSGSGRRMTTEVLRWTARLSSPSGTWADVADRFTIEPGSVQAIDSTTDIPSSPYKRLFRQGAIFVPRVLFVAEDAAAGPLGAGAGRRRVKSRRTTTEKPPWRNVETIERPVESDYVRPIHLGETLVPYRLLEPLLAVLPVRTDRLMVRGEIDDHPGLASWWEEAEARWEANKSKSDKSALLDRLDFHGQLSAQLPTAGHRVVYSASGNTLAAARLEDPSTLIEHKLYWAPVRSIGEGRYLTGILNSRTLLDRVTPLQALGLFGPRDFDKNVFSVPFPAFDESNPDHRELIARVADAEGVAATVSLEPDFKKTRAAVRSGLLAAGIAEVIEKVVGRILPAVV